MEHIRTCLKPGLFIVLLVLIGLLLLSGCANRFDANVGMAASEQAVPGGDVQRGEQLIVQYGCGSCHTIAGVAGANALVGPPLKGIADRAYLAGVLSNTPTNMMVWIMRPQEIVPGNAMPDLGVSEADARDMTAYLYKLHER